MQTRNRFFEDSARLFNGVFGVALEARRQATRHAQRKFQRHLKEMGAVPEEEYQALKQMVLALQQENRDLQTRLEVLEKRLEKNGPARKSSAGRKKT